MAAQLEPDVPTFKSSLAAALIVAGDLERAEQLLHETLRIDPKFGAARERLLRLLERQELLQDAITVRRRMPAMPNADQFDVSWQADGAAGYQRERTAEVRQVIATLETKLLERQPITAGDHFHPPVLRLAMAYAELGEWKKARAWKLQGCAMRPGLLPWFNAEPLLQDLSSHP
ncbi:MAG: hypothetical protein U5K74_13915 [Gemmatimonadaceae bacterium]|nr:hypothetical protein [Gemmatimonadaceae bacterium]